MYKYIYDDSFATFRDNGIYAINGPNWEEAKQKILDTYGRLVYEFVLSSYDSFEPVSVKS